jgi:transcription antitermination factor NusA-like protein
VIRRFKQLPISNANLKHQRWVKLGTLLFYTVKKQKKNTLYTARTKNKMQKKILSCKSKENKTEKYKNYRVASRKSLSL